MKTKFSIFIAAIALLFGVTIASAQGTQAYFKKGGATVFQSPISDIDSIVFYKSVPSGLYLGIIGFNDNLTVKNISQLGSNTKSEFQSFVSNLGMRAATGLYYAVDNAIDMLQTTVLPYDLVNVSIVTFTDGLDNFSIELNYNYNSRDAYRDAISNLIANTRIKNLPIQAYSVGVKGDDVVDIAAFSAGLSALASNPQNVKQVANMSEVNNTFSDIANSLTNVNQSMSLNLKITGGYDDQTKIRFSFDNITDAATSNCYIEGIYRRNGTVRTLENIVYHGLTSNSGATVNGALASGYVTFTFNDVSTINTDNVQQWEYVPSQSLWQRNSEFGQTGDVETTITRKSAVIMLVLDCTTSLGTTDFNSMKTAANNFIDVLANAAGNITIFGGGTENNPYIITTAAELAQLATYVNEGNTNYTNKYYKLNNDIDISSYQTGAGWIPIGTVTYPFRGVFDGNGKKITGLFINNTTLDYVGLFGYIEDGTVKNLAITDININSSFASKIGGVAGYNIDGSISNCYATGLINCTSSSGNSAPWAGGVCGYSSGNVSNCYFTGSVSVYSSNNYSYAGGVMAVGAGSVLNCYSTGTVSATSSTWGSFAGGIVGYWNSYGNGVSNCYSIASVISSSMAGGVVGYCNYSNVSNCAALNPKIGNATTFSRVGYLLSSGTFNNNIAFNNMITPNGGTTWNNKGANQMDGADITAQSINADGTLDGRFISANGWTTANGKLPGLFGNTVDMPAHLK